jgi:hypothetical protein
MPGSTGKGENHLYLFCGKDTGAVLAFSLLVYGLLSGAWGIAIWLLLYAFGYGYTTVLGFLETSRWKKMLE